MTEEAVFTFGSLVSCQDGECGQLERALLDSHEYVITHLVVRSKHRSDRGRLVPIDLVRAVTSEEVQLGCARSQFDAFEAAEETELRTVTVVDVESQHAQVAAMAHIVSPHVNFGMGLHAAHRLAAEDTIPEGEGEVARAQPVHASDGHVGHVLGLVADPSSHRVTYVRLDEGHAWREREVAIPISAVEFVLDDGVHLNLTTKEVRALPPVDLGGAG